MKKLTAILLILGFCLSLVACGSNYAPAVKKEEVKSGTVSIHDYLEDATAYFDRSNINDAKDVNAGNETPLEGEELFNWYVDRWTKAKDLPEELVKSYANAFVNEEEASIDEDFATDSAKQLIKEEMVIYSTYESLALGEITMAMRTAAGGKYGCLVTEGLDDEAYYALDTLIKQEVITAYLEGAELPYGVDKAETEESK